MPSIFDVLWKSITGETRPEQVERQAKEQMKKLDSGAKRGKAFSKQVAHKAKVTKPKTKVSKPVSKPVSKISKPISKATKPKPKDIETEIRRVKAIRDKHGQVTITNIPR